MDSVPIRTCLVCGRKQPKAILRRLAVAAGMLVIDHSGRLGGRGAYCCDNTLCLRKLPRCGKRVLRALRVDEFGWSEELKAFSGVNDEQNQGVRVG